MSEGIFGKNADLAQRLKDRIAFHANEHRHTYEIGKGVMDALALDLLADVRDRRRCDPPYYPPYFGQKPCPDWKP